MAVSLESLFTKLAQADEHARYDAAQLIAKVCALALPAVSHHQSQNFAGPQGRAHFLDSALLPYFRLGLTYDSGYVRSFTMSQLAIGCRDPAVAQHLVRVPPFERC